VEVIKFYDCTVVDSYRTKKQQEEKFRKGLSQVHYPSYHNCQPTFAVDVAPYEMTHIDWDLKQCIYFSAYVMGIAAMLFDQKKITHKIFSGMDWDSDHDINDTKFIDATHFFILPLPSEKMFFVSGT
jgi:hypothetical protein